MKDQKNRSKRSSRCVSACCFCARPSSPLSATEQSATRLLSDLQKAMITHRCVSQCCGSSIQRSHLETGYNHIHIPSTSARILVSSCHILPIASSSLFFSINKENIYIMIQERVEERSNLHLLYTLYTSNGYYPDHCLGRASTSSSSSLCV